MTATRKLHPNTIATMKKARELLAAHWGQGYYYDQDTGCFCLIGALIECDTPGWFSNEHECTITGYRTTGHKASQWANVFGVRVTTIFKISDLSQDSALAYLDAIIANAIPKDIPPHAS